MIVFQPKNTLSIKLLVAKKGLTLRGLSKEIGVSHSYLSQVIKGTKYPSATIAKKISDGLSIGIEDIFFIRSVDEHEVGRSGVDDTGAIISEYR